MNYKLDLIAWGNEKGIIIKVPVLMSSFFVDNLIAEPFPTIKLFVKKSHSIGICTWK